MPVAVDSATSTSGAGVTSLTIAHTAGGTQRVVIAGITLSSGFTVSSVTYGGVAMVQVGTVTNAITAELWQLGGPTTASTSCTASFSGTVGGAVLGVVSFTGASSSDPVGTFKSTTGTSTAASVAAVVSSSNSMVIDCASVNTQITNLVPAVGQTQQWKDDNFNTIGGAGSNQTGAASITMTWGNTNAAWAIGAVSVQSTGGAGGAAAVTAGPSLALLGVGR